MPWGAHDPRDSSVASNTKERVGEILERAEARAREIRERADRSAAESRRTARHEAQGIAQEARRAAATAARARVHRIKQLQASIADRAGALLEGLDGGDLTAARLEELVEALGEAADRVLAEVEDAHDAGGSPPRQPAAHETAAPDGGAVAPRPFGAAGPGPLLGEGKPLPRARPAASRRAPFPRAEPVPGPPRIEDPLPEGAPMVRKPKRSNPRLTAVMMAIQGSSRQDVAEHLAREHDLEDSDELLDEVFGRADARA
jgi:HPt (histidine-containing phosphotransfer) domain-containing protein